MNKPPSSGPEWAGEMLDEPEMMAAFAAQLRKVLAGQAEYVARIRRDAEAMWRENPPEGYSSFEAWWRHRWVTSPFAEIQEHLEEAAKLTFRLEARHRKGRHEIPARRQAAAAAKDTAPELGSGNFGRRQQAERPAGSRPAGRSGADFLDLVRQERGRSA